MANKEILTRIKHKRDTSLNWTINNPVLLNGEIILVDTAEGRGGLRAKIGDGIKTYTQLPFSDEILRDLINDNKVTIDDALSSTSTNPVQNKVINTAINNLNTLIGDGVKEDMPLYIVGRMTLAASQNGTALEPNELAELLRTKHCYILQPNLGHGGHKDYMGILSCSVYHEVNEVVCVKCYYIDSSGSTGSTGSIGSTQNGRLPSGAI